MKKKIIALILMCAIAVSILSACGKPEDDAPKLSEGRTLFIYMCGSNLETKQGLAGKNIDDLLSADAGDLNIVIQTGGTKTWRSHDISNSAAQRYEVKNGELVLLNTLTQLNMGEAQTLTDFLTWGQEQYPANQNMLILWDHGGGAAKGVCFDENYNYDALTLTELKTAFENAKLNTKFDIIGFDACLMASIETAAVVQNFADYMVASEEIEPSGGWDYRALAESFAKETEPLEVGKVICDSYIQKCEKSGKEKLSTLSVFDLSYTDKMLEQFNLAIEIIQTALSDKELSGEVIHALKNVEKFGGGSSYQGSSNMIDLIDVFNHTPNLRADILPGHEPEELTGLWDAVSLFAPYRTQSEYRNAYGVSFYYPVSYNKNEIDSYIDLKLIEPYNKFLRVFYQNIPDTTVAFTDKGSIGEDGAFTVSFTPESAYYLSSVDYILMSTDADGVRRILRTDNNVIIDQESMTYSSSFDGRTLALDGHRMFTTALNRAEGDYIEYNAPVIVNGKKTTLMFDYVYNEDDEERGGYYMIYGTWDGYDDSGLPGNDVSPLKQGDKVQVLTETKVADGRNIEVFSDEFTIGENDGEITELPLEGQTYQYVFAAADLFGNTFTSDVATFTIQDGCKVTNIEPYTTESP